METGARQGSERRKGRPVMADCRNISERLKNAVETGLQIKSHLDLTTREIANEAGTHAGMIHYYYQSKEGLIEAALDDFARGVAFELKRLQERFETDCSDATFIIVKTWFDLHNRYRRLSGVVLIECLRGDSPIWDHYRQRLPKNTFTRMQEIIERLSAKGYYKRDLDTAQAAFSIFCVVHSPIILGTVMAGMGHEVEGHADLWIKQSSRMLDWEFRPCDVQER